MTKCSIGEGATYHGQSTYAETVRLTDCESMLPTSEVKTKQVRQDESGREVTHGQITN